MEILLDFGIGISSKLPNPKDEVNLDDLAEELFTEPITIIHNAGYIQRKLSKQVQRVAIDKILSNEGFGKQNHSLLQQKKNQLQGSNFYNVYKSPLYLDPKGKILEQEQFVPLNQIDEKTNDNSVNIRGLLYALKVKNPESFKDFKIRLLEIFTELNNIDVINNEFTGQFELILHEKLRKNGSTENVTYDINNVGQGMQTLVLMLSTILLLKPSIVLMDEPEVHMHPNLIKEFVKYIQLLSVDTQFIITTHSLVLIQEVGLDKVFSLKNEIDQKGIIVSKVDDKNKLFEQTSN